MGFTLQYQIDPDLRSGVNVTSLIEALRRSGRGELAEALLQIQQALFKIEQVLREPREILGETLEIMGPQGDLRTRIGPQDVRLFDSTGVEIVRLDSVLSIGGNQVVGPRGAAVADVTGTAGAAYTATEQGMINSLKTQLNLALARLRAHGLIA